MKSIKFLESSDLPANWDELLPNCKFFVYKNNYSPVFCLFITEEHEDCFILVAKERYCLILRGEPNSLIGDKPIRRLINDMLWRQKYDNEKLDTVEFDSLDGDIKNDFKAINNDLNPTDIEEQTKAINMIFGHWDANGEYVDNFNKT